jgi:hypothetical protein
MISTRLRFILLPVLLGIAVCSSSCAAGVIAYNSFGPNDSYSFSGNWQGSFFDHEMMLAQRFTPSVGGPLDKIELGLFFHAPSSERNAENVDELTLSLVADVNGKPGTQELWSQFYAGNSPTEHGPVASFDVAAGPTLNAGTMYWLTSRSTPVGFTPHVWDRSLTPHEPLALHYIRGGGPTLEGVWTVHTDSPGFAMRVTLIPEPAAAALMLAATVTLVAIRRHPEAYERRRVGGFALSRSRSKFAAGERGR